VQLFGCVRLLRQNLSCILSGMVFRWSCIRRGTLYSQVPRFLHHCLFALCNFLVKSCILLDLLPLDSLVSCLPCPFCFRSYSVLWLLKSLWPSAFSSCSTLWLLKFCWFPVFSSCSTLWLHIDPIRGLCSRPLRLWSGSFSRMPLLRAEKPENTSLWIWMTDGYNC